MVNREKLIDDAARLAGGAVGVMGSVRAQIKNEIRARIDEMALKFDLVPRAEFERLEAMLQKARLEQESLKKRLDALEGRNIKAKKPTPKPAKKSAAKKKTKR